MLLTRSFFWLLATMLATALGAQTTPPLTIDADYTAERLVREVFANDRCQTIFNVQPIGQNSESVGLFTGSPDIVGFERGIILSTGRVNDAVGPNNDTGTGSELGPETPDPDLAVATRAQIFDRSGIEFDFIPLESTITFRYAFASEEYCEFAEADFNDIFGFFVSGPGLRGPYTDSAINVALVPGTRDPVSINTINHLTNEDFYLNNESVEQQTVAGCRIPGGGTSPRFSDIEYDGQTVILTATINVIPCETYHIRLLVADVSDGNLDSAVFLEAGSFDLGSSVSLRSRESENTPIIAYEGCGDAFLRIERGPDGNLDRPQTVNYRIESGTAQDSVDFSCGTGQATIPIGETFVDIEITTVIDTLLEEEEEALIILDVPCACYSDSVRLLVRDPVPPELTLPDPFLYCPSLGANLSADVTGGVPPFTYEWSFGSTEAAPDVNFALPDSVTLVLTDACGQRTSRTTGTLASEPPTFNLPSQELQACWGDTLTVELGLAGIGPYELTYRRESAAPQTVTITEATDNDWLIVRGGTYQITEVQDRACGIAVDERFRADFYRPVINPTFIDPTCPGGTDGSISATHLPTVAPYDFILNDMPAADLEFTSLAAGAYTLGVTDAIGCTDTTEVVLEAADSIRILDFTCNQLRRRPLELRIAGGMPPYAFSIDGGPFEDDIDWLTLEQGRAYAIEIRDAAGCSYLDPDFYYPVSVERSVVIPTFLTQEVGGSTRVELRYLVPPEQIVGYQWQPAELFDCPTCAEPTLTTPSSRPIGLTVTTVYGCVDSLSAYVAVDESDPIFVPNAFTPDGDGTNDVLAVFAEPNLVDRIVNFEVYNRWGGLVYSLTDFEPNAANQGWNGRFDDRPAPAGVYVYRVSFRMRRDGDVRRTTGSTVLLGR